MAGLEGPGAGAGLSSAHWPAPSHPPVSPGHAHWPAMSPPTGQLQSCPMASTGPTHQSASVLPNGQHWTHPLVSFGPPTSLLWPAHWSASARPLASFGPPTGQRLPTQPLPHRRPLSCVFRLCSNRAASLKETLRPVELADKKCSVSASWPSGSSPLRSGSARRAKRGWAPGGPSLVLGGPVGRRGAGGRRGAAGTRSCAHTLTRSARACAHLRLGVKGTEMSRNRASPSLVGETDRHGRSGGPRGQASGRGARGGPGGPAGRAGRLTLGRVGAVVKVGGGGLFRLLHGPAEGGQRRARAQHTRALPGVASPQPPAARTRRPACADAAHRSAPAERAPVEALMHLPAAFAQQQDPGEHHQGTTDEERHHHNEQHVVVQDGVGFGLQGTTAAGQVSAVQPASPAAPPPKTLHFPPRHPPWDG